MIAFIKSAREWWLGTGIALVLVSLALGGTEAYELAEVRTLSTADAVPVKGTMKVTAKRLTLRNAHEVALDCPTSRCGYPGAGADEGKDVTAHVSNGRIVAVVVQGKYRDTLSAVKEQKSNRLAWYVCQLIVGAGIAYLAMASRPKPALLMSG
ncbi:hypothetical protein [Acidovorax sp. 106]|uniref:hypothetical protein n=1 Tax=Acidovorax sp. 106 TaxID=2135637 RepID=UPI0011C38A60|nr:hypothetical protein [Acidovorax sp. 106]